MKKPIDFTTWTDAQLSAASMWADLDPQGFELMAEIERREENGTWLKDGSKERLATAIKGC